MTEEQWHLETNWERHFEHIGNRLSERKHRLLAAGFCRQLWHLIEDQPVRDAIETAEHYVEKRATVAELERARRQCRDLASKWGHESMKLAESSQDLASIAAHLRSDLAWLGAFLTAGQFDVKTIGARAILALRAENLVQGDAPSRALDYQHLQQQREVLLDLAGDPFRPIEFLLEWRTSTVLALAKSMAESRDFAVMPILADALEDAGCEAEEVLSHCRGSGPHYLGCWVMDGVLADEAR